MFVASFLTFMAIGGFPSFVEDMKVSHSHLLWSTNNLFGPYFFQLGLDIVRVVLLINDVFVVVFLKLVS